MVESTKLYINNQDAYATWGLQLDGGDNSGYDILMSPRPVKEPVVNKNVTAEGAVVVCGTGLVDECTLSIPVHITARGYTDFLQKKNALISYLRNGNPDVTPKGKLTVELRRQWSTVVGGVKRTTESVELSTTMYYLGCNQYTQYSMVQKKNYNYRTDTWTDVPNTGDGMAKFILQMYEPNEPTT